MKSPDKSPVDRGMLFTMALAVMPPAHAADDEKAAIIKPAAEIKALTGTTRKNPNMTNRKLKWLAALGAVAAIGPLRAETIVIPLAETFRAQCAVKAEAADKAESMTVVGRDGWLFLGRELRHVGAGKFWGEAAAKVSQATKPENADPLPAILDFKAQLDKAKIDLLLVPVPPKAVIYPEMILPGAMEDKDSARLDPLHQEFYALLRKNGIKVLDLTADFLAQRKAGPVYCKTDTHWSGQGCALAAQRIAAETRTRAWFKDVAKTKFAQARKPVRIEGDLAQALGPQAPPKETLTLNFVGKGATLAPVEPSKESPVILLGDSHNLIFHAGEDMLATGAGLPDQLALELGFPVDLMAVRGSGATPARINLLRQVRANPDYLKKKKLVIWCFSAREFTESSGWQKVPVVR